jgi:ribonuclease HI
MKTLKLDHASAQLIKESVRTSTWRVYDGSDDICVDDELELIDKVDPSLPATWQSIGIARIDSIAEQRLGSIPIVDLGPENELKSQQQILEYLKDRCGREITLVTPVQLIRFTLLKAPGAADIQPRKTTQIREANLYADGGSRGNPGPSASGFAITDMHGEVIVKKGLYLGLTTNNQAEYQALKLGLEEAHGMGVRELHVYMDSLLVINQMLGIFKVKNRDLWPIHDAVKQLLPVFSKVHFTHIPRELNKLADRSVNDALDEAIDNPKA